VSVIIAEPSSSGVALVEAAHRIGQAAVVFTADQGDRQLSAACRKLATSVVVVDTNDADAVFHAAQGVSREEKLEAIVPGFEYVVDVVAKAASRLGLPHLSPQAATVARNKFACRERLRSMALDVPRYALIGNESELEGAASQVGFPAVIKPTDSCGSLLVRRVDSLSELRSVVYDFAAYGLLDMGNRVGLPFLLEEFLAGDEFSIEGYIDQGEPHVVAVTEKQLGTAPYFVEMGHIVQAELPEHERKSLVTYIQQVVRATGLELGVFHAEARITERGPVLIEIAARLGGDRIYRLVELTQGLSLPEIMMRSYCGWKDPASTDRFPHKHGVAGVRFLSVDSPRFGAAYGLDDVRAMTGYEEAELYFRPGDLVPRLTDFRGRVGHVLFAAEDRPTLEKRLRQAENCIRFVPQEPAYTSSSPVQLDQFVG